MYSEDYFKELNPMQRFNQLESIADEITEGTYFKPLNDEEKISIKDHLASTCIAIQGIEEKKKESIKSFDDLLKPEKELKGILISQLRNGGSITEGKLYLIRDFDSGNLLTFNSDGTLVSTRRLKPTENQLTIKTANHGN